MSLDQLFRRPEVHKFQGFSWIQNKNLIVYMVTIFKANPCAIYGIYSKSLTHDI